MTTYEALALPLDAPCIGQTRRNDEQSSVDGARLVSAQRQRDIFARELSDAPEGLTADQLEARTGIKREHISSRLKQMERWGQTFSQGKRLNGNNIRVKVWHLRSSSRPVESVATASRL